MAKSRSKTAARRAEIRAERHARRDEIIERWQRRNALRMFHNDIRKPNLTADALIDHLLWYRQWISYPDLVEELQPHWLPVVLTYAVRVIELKEMPYDEYLQTPEWKAKASKAKTRYQNECALDATHMAEDAHHRTYTRRGRERVTDILPLCRECHGRFHGKVR